MTSRHAAKAAAGRRDATPTRRVAALIAKEMGAFTNVKLLRPAPGRGELHMEWYENVAMICHRNEVIAVGER